MILIAEHSVRISLLVAAALAAVALLRSGSAALRHWLLAVALAGAAAMPILSVVAPSWHVAVPRAVPAPPRAAAAAASLTIMQDPDPDAANLRVAPVGGDGRAHAPGIAAIVVAVWTAGILVSGSFVAVGLIRLRRLAASAARIDGGRLVELTASLAREAGFDRPIAILQGRDAAPVCTWGAARPKILLPQSARTWSDDRLRIVLRHELAHIRRADWLAQMVGEIVRAVNWFNPIVWLACARLRRESEHACDDAVLAAGVDPADYAGHLVDLARTLNIRRPARVPAPAMARLSTLEGRVSAMLNHRLDRRPITRAKRCATAVALLCLTLSVAGLAGQRYSKFSGVVLDQTDAFLPNVAVSLTSADRQTRHEVRTDRTGRFEFVGLPDGDYVIAALQAGFASFSEPLTIAGRDVDRPIQLHVGSLHETIVVTAGGSAAKPYDPELRQKARQWAEDKSREVSQRCSGGSAAGGVGGNILQPMKIADVKPRYPERLQAAGTGGLVTLEALIGTDGTVRDVRVVTSADPDLDRAAMDAVRQWEFSSTILNCTPVEVPMGITVKFVAKR